VNQVNAEESSANALATAKSATPSNHPPTPTPPAQVAEREIWRAVNARWPKLTPEQCGMWIAFASTVNSKPRLGQSGPLTGYQLFMKINSTLAYWGKPQVDLPPPYPQFPQLAVSSLSVANVANVLKITLGCAADLGAFTVLRASAPQSARRETCTDFRIIGACPAPVQASADITALYLAKFGVPPVGSKLFLQVNQMIDGWQNDPRKFTAAVSPATRPPPQPPIHPVPAPPG
jgi:hypothetical protein